MTKNYTLESKSLFEKIRILANPARFKIYELSKENKLNETQISDILKMKYKRVSESINKMKRAGLVYTTKIGREEIVGRRTEIKAELLKPN